MSDYFIFDDIDTRDYEGILVYFNEVDTTPKRVGEFIQIPNRNGSFFLDGGRYEDVTHTYDIVALSKEDASDLINALASKVGYFRLQDSFNTDEFYSAVFNSEIEPKITKERDKLTFKVTFTRKPQRWLTSGETAVTIGEWRDTETVTGDIVEVENPDEILGVKSLSVALSPIQDLHGYDKPWAGGAGKNKLSNNYYEKSVTSKNGITYTVNDDGSITLQGTSTSQGVSNWEMILTGGPSGLKAGTYIISADGLQSGVQIIFGGKVSSVPYYKVTYQNTSRQFTLSSDDDTLFYCLIQVNGRATINTTIFPMIRLASETDATYEPYENLCPISGRTEVKTIVSPTTSATDGRTYTTSLGRTVYGGTLDVVSGELVVDRGYIASYNGETLPSTWISDRDVYASGTTPTIGAEVVYELATPQTYQLTPTEVALLKGNNNVWSDGDVTLEYGQDPNVIVNPTLFESSPLLEIEGYGSIGFNGYEIEIDNTDLGEVVVYPRALPNANITITIDTQYLNQGDSIYFGKGNNDLYFSYSFGSGTYKTYAGTVSSQVNVKDASITNYSSYGLTFKMSPDTGTGFVYGTPRTINSSLVFYYTNNNIQYPQTVNTSISYDGNDSITFSYARTGTESSDIHIDTNPYVCINKIYAFSTSPIDIGTIYVDCDLGECYLEESGTITPINQQVDLGSRLPTLASGTNEIIFDNTITELNITPRWWKI